MEKINPGAMVICNAPFIEDCPKKGTVVKFEERTERNVTHRVYQVLEEGTGYRSWWLDKFVTKEKL